MTTILTAATFDEAVSADDLPIVVDFWAQWCGPCKLIAPILDEFSMSQSARFRVAKIDVDAYPEIAARYSVMSIPTVLVLRRGEVVGRIVGARSSGALLQSITDAI
jgi:thioredoxin 1